MQIPVQFTFRNFPRSEAVEARIRAKAAKLEELDPHIMSCHVVVEELAGAFSRPCSKRSRTRAAPTPTNISTNSEPLIEKKGRLLRPRPLARATSCPFPEGRPAAHPWECAQPASSRLIAALDPVTWVVMNSHARCQTKKRVQLFDWPIWRNSQVRESGSQSCHAWPRTWRRRRLRPIHLRFRRRPAISQCRRCNQY